MGWRRSCKAAAFQLLLSAQSRCQGAAGAAQPCPPGLPWEKVGGLEHGMGWDAQGTGPSTRPGLALPPSPPPSQLRNRHGTGPVPSQLSPKNTLSNLISCPLSDLPEIREQVPNPPPPLCKPADSLGNRHCQLARGVFGAKEARHPPPVRGGFVTAPPTFFPFVPSVHLQRSQQGDVCPAPRALLPSRLLHRLRCRLLLPLPGHLLRERAAVPARRYAGRAAGTGSPCLGGRCQG